MTTTPPNTSPTAIPSPSPPPEPPPVVLAPIPPPSVPPLSTPPLAPTDLVPPSFAPPPMSISPQSPMSASSPGSKPPPVPPPTPAGTSPPPSVTNPPQSSTNTPPSSTNTPPSSTPTQASTPPPQTFGSPPPPQTSSPPKTSPPPPQTSSPPMTSPPPPQTSSPPKTSPPPPQTSSPPKTSPPPPPPQTSSPPKTSPPPPPPQTSSPPKTSPPPQQTSSPPKTSPPVAPPQTSSPPKTSPPPPQTSSPSPPPPVPEPPPSSPPPPRADPPNSPPPPASSTHSPSPASPPKPPSNSPAAPPSTPTKDAPPPPIPTPRNPTPAPPPSKSIPRPLPPPPPLRLGSPSFLHPPPSPSPFVSPTLEENSKSRHSNGIDVGVIAAISVSVVVIILILIGLSIWCMKWRKVASGRNGGYIMPAYSSGFGTFNPDSNLKKMGSPAPLMGSSASLMGSGSSSDIFISPTQSDRLDSSKTWFTYEEIVKATNGFSSQNLLGEGGFGSVYKGCLPDGREVAVKQLNIWGGQGEREFKAEVEIISRIHHRHLVSLVGYCISESQRLLLYDYVPNNTLHFHLHGEGGPGLDWAARFRIALGAARGLAYLHEDCDPRVIHRDIKSSNILLDDKFEAKVSDFGLAKMAVDANTHVTTRVMGTFGYMAPEYASTGRLTEKSDVFSFGVVLLELITGRKPVDTTRPLGDESLVEWARPLLNDVQESEGIDGLVDPRLGKDYIESEMLRMMKAAAACVRHSAATRPRMSQVLRAFESSYSVDLTNGMRVGSSLVFNSDIQSEQIRLFQRMAGGNMNYTTDFFSLESYNTQR